LITYAIQFGNGRLLTTYDYTNVVKKFTTEADLKRHIASLVTFEKCIGGSLIIENAETGEISKQCLTRFMLEYWEGRMKKGIKSGTQRGLAKIALATLRRYFENNKPK
jgi:hypothetical protein